MKYPAYRCFNTDDRTVYCSLERVGSHGDGNEWIEAACANFDLRPDQINGQPYVSERQPKGAIIWPYGPTVKKIWPA